MGKVGSMFIYCSLREQYDGLVLHAHKFSEDDRRADIRALHRWAIRDSKPLNVISLTRDPIAKNLSAFFEDFRKNTGVPYVKSSFSIAELKTT